MVSRRPIRGAVLAGGATTRYGGKPKGLERVGGERILDRVVRAVWDAVGDAPLLVANSEEAMRWHDGLQVTKDLIPSRGALSGLHTAVAHDNSPVLVVAWDMPFVPTALLSSLLHESKGFDVFLPESTGPRGVEPMCGVYARSCLEAIESAMTAGDYRATGFHQKVNVGTLSLSEVFEFGPPETIFFNVNTPEDLERAEELWRIKPE